MTEEAEIDGLARARADFSHLLPDLMPIEHRAGERPERARLRRGRREFPIHGAGHWRLHDWKLDLEQLDETAVRPHGSILDDVAAYLITFWFDIIASLHASRPRAKTIQTVAMKLD